MDIAPQMCYISSQHSFVFRFATLVLVSFSPAHFFNALTHTLPPPFKGVLNFWHSLVCHYVKSMRYKLTQSTQR